MTVAELKKILENISPNSEVLFQYAEGTYVPITSVEHTQRWYGDTEYNETIISWLD